jgi:hypothetical protein
MIDIVDLYRRSTAHQTQEDEAELRRVADDLPNGVTSPQP